MHMKIRDIKTFVVNGGYRPWIFVKVETDEGITGWGDACDWDAPETVVKAVDYLKGFLVGEDPMATEKIWFKNSQVYRRMVGGIAWKAMSGIDTALWDIKGKALGVPVWQLLGGKIHDRLRLYWSHCGTARHKFSKHIAEPPIRTLSELREFAYEVKASGVTALKTNIMALEDTPYCGMPAKPIQNGIITNEEVKTI
jgi:galactonate dehydratase